MYKNSSGVATSNAVKQVGLFDERFCNIGLQEADYFLRCLLYNKDRSSLNDIEHDSDILTITIASRM
jgi:hypothetical protein